jgi:hypothetical protein
MKRIGRFLRSVIPTDPWQLVFLSGVIFLFICPRLPWRPSAEMFISKAVPAGPISESETKSFGLVIVLLYPALFAGLMAYATCFYPGPRPVRRILGLVLLPALLALCPFFSFSIGSPGPGRLFWIPTPSLRSCTGGSGQAFGIALWDSTSAYFLSC